MDITTEPENLASQKVILANGGRVVGPFRRVPGYGDDATHLLFRIDL